MRTIRDLRLKVKAAFLTLVGNLSLASPRRLENAHLVLSSRLNGCRSPTIIDMTQYIVERPAAEAPRSSMILVLVKYNTAPRHLIRPQCDVGHIQRGC